MMSWLYGLRQMIKLVEGMLLDGIKMQESMLITKNQLTEKENAMDIML